MDANDRNSAFAAFDAALALSPSSALTYYCGSAILGWGGEAERAIEWAERGIRLSPFDPWRFAAYHALTLGHFHRGQANGKNSSYWPNLDLSAWPLHGRCGGK